MICIKILNSVVKGFFTTALMENHIKQIFYLEAIIPLVILKIKISERSDVMVKKHDLVKMNNKYYVSEKNKDKVFKVITDQQEVCGTVCVWLDDFRGCYAADGLTVVGSQTISAAGR